MTCGTCQSEVLEGSDFCPLCSAQVGEPPEPTPEAARYVRRSDPFVDFLRAKFATEFELWLTSQVQAEADA